MGKTQPKPGQTQCEWQRDLIPEGEDCGTGFTACPWYNVNDEFCDLFEEKTTGSKVIICKKNKYLKRFKDEPKQQ
jgi:Zn-finger protein